MKSNGQRVHSDESELILPLSLAYIYFVFGFLLLRVADWSFTNIPTLSLILLLIWGIYSILPEPKS